MFNFRDLCVNTCLLICSPVDMCRKNNCLYFNKDVYYLLCSNYSSINFYTAPTIILS